jgi:hypothetical protein
MLHDRWTKPQMEPEPPTLVDSDQHSPDLPRNQHGRTWAEEEAHLCHLLTNLNLVEREHIIRRQKDLFAFYVASTAAATDDARHEIFAQAYRATPPERRRRYYETMRRDWT